MLNGISWQRDPYSGWSGTISSSILISSLDFQRRMCSHFRKLFFVAGSVDKVIILLSHSKVSSMQIPKYKSGTHTRNFTPSLTRHFYPQRESHFFRNQKKVQERPAGSLVVRGVCYDTYTAVRYFTSFFWRKRRTENIKEQGQNNCIKTPLIKQKKKNKDTFNGILFLQWKCKVEHSLLHWMKG